MEYTNADVFVYQILDCLVTQYDYKIVNVPRNKKDIWLASETNTKYPMIRLSAVVSSSAVFEQDYLSKIKNALSMVLNKKSPLLVINTNDESRSFVEGDFVQIVMTDEYISDTAILDEFPSLHNALRKVANNQDECARLTRHLESNQMRKMKEARKFRWKDAPKVSCVIALIMLAVYLIMMAFSLTGATNAENFVAAGAYYKALVVYGHEYWRIFTTGFINLDLITLLFYMLVLYQLGRVCENTYGKMKYALIFFASLFIGNIFPLLFDGNVVSIGMGAGIFGILGAFIVYVRETKLYKNKLARMQINQVLMIAIISMLLNGTMFSAQIGGLLVGIFIAIIVYDSPKLKEYKKHFILCGMMILGMLSYYAIGVDTAYPENSEFDTKIVKKYHTLGLHDYADHIKSYLSVAYEE
ncbi:MAG: rhomboid family intramembrane serine protease [Erysipelotrichia bacterium]|nr:rhomboid family intramembrane serine protease [Erysipelotrichia bacterium]